MVDEKIENLLKFIKENAEDSYAIFTADDILHHLASKVDIKKEELFNLFKCMQTKGFIRLKYNDGISFCCMLSDRGNDYIERVIDSKNQRVKECENVKPFLVFVYSFLGGVVGCFLFLFLSKIWGVL